MSIHLAPEGLSEKDIPNRPVSTTEAAERLGVHPKTIRDWVNNGKIPGYRVGFGRIIVDLDDVDSMFHRIVPEGGVR